MQDNQNIAERNADEAFVNYVTRYHILGAWIAVVLNPLWTISDYFSGSPHWKTFLLIRILISLLTFSGIALKKILKLSPETIVLIPFIGISIQNAYIYSLMDFVGMQRFTFAYVGLFLGAGMLILWKPFYSYIVFLTSLFANILFFSLFSSLSLNEILFSGILLTITVAIISLLLIHSRYTSARNSIITRFTLAETNRELTIQKEASERNALQLKEAKEKAEQLSQARQEFLSLMSHEIRTPLNAVLGTTHLLMEEDPLPEQMENLKILQFSSNNLLALINNILDFSKIESGKLELEHIDFDLINLTQRVMNSFRHTAKEKQLKLELHLQRSIPPQLVGDPVRLTQILTNLIHNAIKFTDHGEVFLRINSLKQSEDKIDLMFEVADTGTGIESNRLNEIFDSFTQARSSITRQFGGTGLGLTICKKLVSMLGGEIKVKSEFGKGSTFSFNLAFGISQNENRINLMNPPLHNKISLSGIKILLVEDNLTNQLLAKKFIIRWGAGVDTADNGKSAIEKVQQRKYDLVLMDLQMPEMDGYESNRKIRELGFSKEALPIIALTAYAMEDDRFKVMEAGMNDFISKPIDPDELYKKIVKNVKVKPANPERFGNIPSLPGEVLSLEELLESFDSDDLDFKKKYLNLFAKEFRELPEKISGALSSHDLNAMKNIIHKITPSVKRVKEDSLLNYLNTLSIFLQNNDSDHSAPEEIIAGIKLSCENILKTIENLQLKYVNGSDIKD